MALDPAVKDYLLELIENRLLVPGPDALPNDWFVVRRLEDALFACGKGDNPSGAVAEINEEAVDDWHEVFGSHMVDLSYETDRTVPNWKDLRTEYKRARSAVRGAVERKLKELISWEASEQGYEDFGHVFDLMHKGECPEKLPGLLKLAYESGVWPCGWLGKYPDGKLIVYWPHDEDPKQ